MPKKTEAQKKAQRAYIDKFARVEIRMSIDHRDTIKSHADRCGESLNSFINRAIVETMDRDMSARKENYEFRKGPDGEPILPGFFDDSTGSGVVLVSKTTEDTENADK